MELREGLEDAASEEEAAEMRERNKSEMESSWSGRGVNKADKISLSESR